MQVLTWLVFAFNFGLYYAVDVITLSTNLGVAMFLSVQYLLISAVVVYFGVVATVTDPSDPTIKLEKQCLAEG